VKQLYSFFHWTLESLATSDQSEPPARLLITAVRIASRKVVTKFMGAGKARLTSEQTRFCGGACVLGKGKDTPAVTGRSPLDFMENQKKLF